MTDPLIITKRQTTYWDFLSEKGVVRVHFQKKQEYSFFTSIVPFFTIVREHPVLFDYQFSFETIYIASRPERVNHLLQTIRNTTYEWTQGWRVAEHYLNSSYGAERLLKSGHGLFFCGPEPLAKQVSQNLVEANVEFYVRPGGQARWPMEALIAEPNFVVAKSFRIQSMPPKPAVQPKGSA